MKYPNYNINCRAESSRRYLAPKKKPKATKRAQKAKKKFKKNKKNKNIKNEKNFSKKKNRKKWKKKSRQHIISERKMKALEGTLPLGYSYKIINGRRYRVIN